MNIFIEHMSVQMTPEPRKAIFPDIQMSNPHFISGYQQGLHTAQSILTDEEIVSIIKDLFLDGGFQDSDEEGSLHWIGNLVGMIVAKCV